MSIYYHISKIQLDDLHNVFLKRGLVPSIEELEAFLKMKIDRAWEWLPVTFCDVFDPTSYIRFDYVDGIVRSSMPFAQERGMPSIYYKTFNLD